MYSRILPIMIFMLVGIFGVFTTGKSDEPAPEYAGYVVRQGQTLVSIAADFGLPVEYLAKFNHIAPDTVVVPGTPLQIPLPPGSPEQPRANAEATTPRGDVITGVRGIVADVSLTIHAAPDGGRVLCRNVARGTALLVTLQTPTCYGVLMEDGSTGWVPKSGVELTEETVSIPLQTATPDFVVHGEGRPDIVQAALAYLGTPYKLGGRLPASVDCSLLVQTVYAQFGVRLPRTAAQQYTVGTPVEINDLVAGDRLYFQDKTGRISHTGLYMGDGQFVHASSNRRMVAVDLLSNPTYWRKYAGARR